MNIKHQKQKLVCQFKIVIPIFIVLFFLNIGFKYFQYKQFVSKNQFVIAKIVLQYKKKNYWVLKLKNSNIEFYTTTYNDLKDILNKEVEINLITKNISFWGYLTKFYAPTFYMGILETPNYKSFIKKQHSNKQISNIFKALFFGDSLYYQTRQQLSTLGISHLLALSGLHLTIISGVLYLILNPVFNFLFPPYINRNIYLGIVILIILFIYLFFVNFPASLVRSFIMEIIIFLFAFSLKDIFSFKLLFLTVLSGITIFPSFLVNLGFFLSVMGVFLIFLFFKYFKFNLINGTIILPIFLYIAMFPISHYFFGNFNYYQLLSPIVTILFTIFYPFEIFLHLIGEGGIIDPLIKEYLLLGDKFREIYINTPIFYSYIFILIIFSTNFFPKWLLNRNP